MKAIQCAGRFVVATALMISLVLIGCGGGTPQSSTTTAPPASTSNASAIPVFSTTPYPITVTLPAGISVQAQQLKVIDSLDSETPDATGKVTMSAYTLAPQVALVLSPNGNPMMMGWLDGSHTTISAGTTAEVLAYYALGGAFMLEQSDRAALEAAIISNASLAALTKTVAAELVSNVDAFVAPDANLTVGVESFVTAATAAGVTKSVRRNGIVITPGDQSGLDVQQLPPYQADIVNSYRRRSHAFVQRLSDVTGVVKTADAADVTDFEIVPTTGTNGGVAGAVTDIFNAYYGNQATAYADVTSAPFTMPLTTGVDQTNYMVTVVGPGLGNIGLIPTLTGAQAISLVQVSVAGYVTDALVPFYANAVFGSGLLDGPTGVLGADPAKFKANLISAFETDFLGFLPSLPGLQDMILQGDWLGASTLLLTNEANSGSLRTIFIDAVQKAVTATIATDSTFQPGALTSAAKSFNVILNAAGGLLQIFDSTVYISQIKNANAVSQWQIAVTGTKVTLTPSSASVVPGGVVNLSVAVPGIEDTSGYSYSWTTTGQYGTISGSGGTNVTSFCASSPNITYNPLTSDSQNGVSDSVTVAVYSGSNCKTSATSMLLGSALSTITISTQAGVAVTPGSAIVPINTSQQFTAQLQGGSTGTTYYYLWQIPTIYGSLTPIAAMYGEGPNTTSICSTSPTVTFYTYSGFIDAPSGFNMTVAVSTSPTCASSGNIASGKAVIVIPQHDVTL